MAQQPRETGRPHDREDLTGEHRIGDTGQMVLAVLFAVVWIVDSFFIQATTFLNDLVPNAIRVPVGLALLALAGYLAKTSHSIVFGQIRETPKVIREGLYGVVRHPMYLSEILLYLGLLALSLSLAAAVVWVAVIFFLYAISRYEERLLLARFGETYEAYMRKVPMWLPRLRRR